MTTFKKLFKSTKTLIGMIHLPPLPGYPTHPGMDEVIKKALVDLEILQKSGFDAVLVENDNDQPHQISVNQTVKNAFEQVMLEVIKSAKVPVGMEIIYDMLATIEVAHKVGAKFVRLDVYVDNVETKWGKIPAEATKIRKLVNKLKADDLVLLTDIQVKHARMLDKKTLAQSAKEAIKEGSNCIIVTGTWTGIPPSVEDCNNAKKAAGDIPVIVGSGLNTENAVLLLKLVDGAIVGSSIKNGEYVNFLKAKNLAKIVKQV